MTKREEDYIESIIDVEMRARVLRTQEAGQVTKAMFKWVGRTIAGAYGALINLSHVIDECYELNEKVKTGKAKSIKITDHFV